MELVFLRIAYITTKHGKHQTTILNAEDCGVNHALATLSR